MALEQLTVVRIWQVARDIACVISRVEPHHTPGDGGSCLFDRVYSASASQECPLKSTVGSINALSSSMTMSKARAVEATQPNPSRALRNSILISGVCEYPISIRRDRLVYVYLSRQPGLHRDSASIGGLHKAQDRSPARCAAGGGRLQEKGSKIDAKQLSQRSERPWE